MYRFALATAVVCLGSLTACNQRDLTGETHTDTKSVPLDKSEMTRVEFKMGAGEMNVSGGATDLMQGEFTYNIESWKPQIDYHSTGSRSDLQIFQPPGVRMGGPDVKNRWEVRLNDGATMDLIAKLGAGEANLDLGSLNLRSLELEIGVGEVTVDLRGMPKRSYDVRISGGVGSAKVYLPATVAIHATAAGGIGEINMRGLEERNGRWINTRAENSPILIRVDAKGGVGEIEMIAE